MPSATSGVLAGQYVLICVSDTGVGHGRGDAAERAFEPFFTTKEVGKGTGLGLSMVYGFVKQSGGHVKIYSEPGEGTTVKHLPAAPRRRRGHVEEERPRKSRSGGKNETILVCEDDDEVRALLGRDAARAGLPRARGRRRACGAARCSGARRRASTCCSPTSSCPAA